MELKNESGLIYVHLNNARDLNKKVTVFDKNGQQHVVDIDRTCFYVAKTAQPDLLPHLRADAQSRYRWRQENHILHLFADRFSWEKRGFR